MVSLRAMNFVTAILSAQTVWRSSTDSTATAATLLQSEKLMKKCAPARHHQAIALQRIAAAKSGKRIGDISNAVQTFCERAGYSVVREMCGHGIGKSMHEDPEVPNFGRRGIGPVLKPGMCIAIEPMINMGKQKCGDRAQRLGMPHTRPQAFRPL